MRHLHMILWLGDEEVKTLFILLPSSCIVLEEVTMQVQSPDSTIQNNQQQSGTYTDPSSLQKCTVPFWKHFDKGFFCLFVCFPDLLVAFK